MEAIGFRWILEAGAIVNLRRRPGGDVIALLPYNVTLIAFEWAGGWHLVEYHGTRGWVSGEYVKPSAACG